MLKNKKVGLNEKQSAIHRDFIYRGNKFTTIPSADFLARTRRLPPINMWTRLGDSWLKDAQVRVISKFIDKAVLAFGLSLWISDAYLSDSISGSKILQDYDW